MIREKITFKTGDTAAAQNVQLLDRNRDAVELTGATVVMQVKDHDSAISCEIIDAADGTVSPGRGGLEPDSNKTSKAFLAEFEVTFSDGSIQTYPERDYIEVEVWADLDPS